jgi:zinc/manganese transport system substrate-binding protein
MNRSKIAAIAVIASAALVLAACSSADSETSPETSSETSPETSPETTSETTAAETAPSEESEVTVVATTSILGDVAGQIIECAGGTVTVLMPIGTDPHDFSASSDQVASMINADLVISNGLGLESGLTDSMANAATDGANIFEVGPLIDPIEFGASGHSEEGHSDEEGHSHEDGHSDEEGHDHGSFDPHFWFDMTRMAVAAQLIGAELTEVTGNQEYTTCANTTAESIRSAEGDVRALLEAVPADQRILVTDHEALGYLADTYGYEIAGTVIPAGTTLAEPSSADLANLVKVINAEGVNVIFTNAAQPSALADAVAAETGRDIAVVPLYVESLGAPDSPAATYIDMMRTNAQLISEGLQG